MDDRYIEFLKKGSIFYEPIKSNKHDFKIPCLDETWTINKTHDWEYCIKTTTQLPKQGWKIHITTTLEQAQKCLNIIVPYLVDKSISFKFVPNIEELLMKNSKYGDRASSGKFITIYPKKEEEFIKMLPELAKLLSNFETGPYILNDKQWFDSNVFFRYGAFQKMTTVVDGREVFAIQSPDGKLIPDIREPFYEVPKFIKEPLVIQEMTKKQNIKFNREDTSEFDKYDIKSAMHFSNAGGVYKALYKGDTFVIKEGRSQAGMDQLNRDGFKRLNNEYQVLKKLKNKSYLVKEKEYFEIWENNYLVEEFIEGKNLSDFIAQNFPFSTYQDQYVYAQKAKNILNQLKEDLIDLHNSGYAMGDLQPSNIIVLDSNKIKLIDLETATKIKNKYIPGLQTPGFVNNEVNSFEEADWFAYWRIVRFMFLPIGPVSDLTCTIEKYQNIELKKYFGTDIYKFIQDTKKFVSTKINFTKLSQTKNLEAFKLSENIDEIIEGLSKGITNNINYDSKNLIFGDIKQYTDKFGGYSIAYGAFGAIMTLSRIGKLSIKDKNWARKTGENILKHVNKLTPLGLFNGVTGICCVLYEIGEKELAIDMLEKVNISNTTNDITIYSGLSGIGLAYLSFYKVTKKNIYLNKAQNILIKLKQILFNKEEIRSTNNSEIPYGFMHGWTGAAYFVFEMSKVTNKSIYEKLAKRMLKEEIDKNLLEDKKTQTAQIVDYSLGIERLIPYLGEGSIGVALVLNELKTDIKSFDYDELLKKLCNVQKTFCCYSPGLTRGATGFLLLQILSKNNKPNYKYDLSILQNYLLRSKKDNSIFCPGDYNYRISLDVFTGNSGVILGLLGLKNFTWDLWIPTIRQ